MNRAARRNRCSNPEAPLSLRAAYTARGFMLALGCVQSLKCATGRCPSGITASDPRLVRGLDVEDKAARVASYATRVIGDVATIAHSCGLPDPSGFRKQHVVPVPDVPVLRLE